MRAGADKETSEKRVLARRPLIKRDTETMTCLFPQKNREGHLEAKRVQALLNRWVLAPSSPRKEIKD